MYKGMVVICRHVGTDSRVCEVRNSRVKSSGAAVYVLGAKATGRFRATGSTSHMAAE